MFNMSRDVNIIQTIEIKQKLFKKLPEKQILQIKISNIRTTWQRKKNKTNQASSYFKQIVTMHVLYTHLLFASLNS